MNRGIAYGRKKEIDKEISDYLKSAEINPRQFTAYHNLGNTYRNWGKNDKSIEYYTKAIETEPEDNDDYYKRLLTDSYYERGIVYEFMGKMDLAIADYTKAIELNPNKPDFYDKRSQLYMTKKETDKAKADRSKARELRKKSK